MNAKSFRTVCGALLMTALAMPHSVCAQTPHEYDELPNPVATDPAAWGATKKVVIGWGDTDTRYKKEMPAGVAAKTVKLTAWRGERVSAQLAVSTPIKLEEVALEAERLKGRGGTIDSKCVSTAFVRYVLADELEKEGVSSCSARNQAEFEHFLVADPIDHLTASLDIEPNTTRCAWVSIDVPRNVAAGTYKGSVRVKSAGRTMASLRIELTVVGRTLPAVADRQFHLDLWQNPYAVARYYGVEPFTDAFFDVARPIMQLYADAGGKTITTTLTHRPWNGQTLDAFASMVTWMKKADGTWSFDYTAFDRWVEFMIGLGIKKQISCYSMIPWRLSFDYLDQATNSFRTIDAKPGDKAYEDLWVEMLRSFAAHLKTKGWFDMTYIAMDERGLDDMLATLKVLRKADSEFKVALAGNYHKELEDELDDYCVIIPQKFPAETLERRRSSGKNTTFYTCCGPIRPNTFIQSPPAEAEWLAWHSAKEGFDGYLRWAYNSWTESPLTDACFRTWAAGDPFLVYPDGRSSIRFERLREGMQQYEKVLILKKEAAAKSDNKTLQRIAEALDMFDPGRLDSLPATEAVRRARAIINSL